MWLARSLAINVRHQRLRGMRHNRSIGHQHLLQLRAQTCWSSLSSTECRPVACSCAGSRLASTVTGAVRVDVQIMLLRFSVHLLSCRYCGRPCSCLAKAVGVSFHTIYAGICSQWQSMTHHEISAPRGYLFRCLQHLLCTLLNRFAICNLRTFFVCADISRY